MSTAVGDARGRRGGVEHRRAGRRDREHAERGVARLGTALLRRVGGSTRVGTVREHHRSTIPVARPSSDAPDDGRPCAIQDRLGDATWGAGAGHRRASRRAAGSRHGRVAELIDRRQLHSRRVLPVSRTAARSEARAALGVARCRRRAAVGPHARQRRRSANVHSRGRAGPLRITTSTRCGLSRSAAHASRDSRSPGDSLARLRAARSRSDPVFRARRRTGAG